MTAPQKRMAPPKRIVVIGAGAAGLVAATQAARRGASVTLLEKNSKTGVKILMSGGTRCNLTHHTDAKGIAEAFGHAKRFLQPSVGRFTPQDVIKMFHEVGVATKVESTGKVFPCSNRALDVRNALQSMAIDAGVSIALKTSVLGITKEDSSGLWQVETVEETFLADAVIVTSGGKSWPGCGTTGDAYAWLSKLGHTIIRPRPALVPLVGGTPWMNQLSGITLEDCVATVRARNESGQVLAGRKSILTMRRSSMLWTHFGLSGPAAMDISGTMTGAPSFRNVQLEIDLIPTIETSEIEKLVMGDPVMAKRKPVNFIGRWLPQRLASSLIEDTLGKHHDPKSPIGPETPIGQLPRTVRRELIVNLKRLPIPISGTRGFKQAEVTAGGVKLSEVNAKTMESKLHSGLFIAGEVLDVDGLIGGYNFQAAFSTGHTAAMAATHVETA